MITDGYNQIMKKLEKFLCMTSEVVPIPWELSIESSDIGAT
jgi:hypothetical protein